MLKFSAANWRMLKDVGYTGKQAHANFLVKEGTLVPKNKLIIFSRKISNVPHNFFLLIDDTFENYYLSTKIVGNVTYFREK